MIGVVLTPTICLIVLWSNKYPPDLNDQGNQLEKSIRFDAPYYEVPWGPKDYLD